MNKHSLFFLLFYLISNLNIFASEYDFNVTEFKKKNYEILSNIEFNPVINQFNKNSLFYKLKYYNQPEQDYTDIYYLNSEINFKYEIKKYVINSKFNFELSNIDNDYEFNETLYELYLNYNSDKFSIYAGKQSLKWGKGYIWNPVNFAGRQKDINDVDANLEGYYLINFEKIVSLKSDVIDNLAYNFVILPSEKDFNENYNYKHINLINKLYLLIYNIDIDFYLLWNNKNYNKFGIDFSKNIYTNWEIHFEYAYENNVEQYFFNNSGLLDYKTKSNNNFLIGTRYLTQNEITLIFEYLHYSSGLTNEQTGFVYNEIRDAIKTNTNVNYYKQILNYFNTQFVSEDYLYLKLSKPEPYDILYFTPSIYSVYNICDKSVNTGLEFKYTRFTNLELLLKLIYLNGTDNSQYNEKLSDRKIDLKITYYF